MPRRDKLALLLSSLAILLPIPVGFYLSDRFVMEMPVNLGMQIVLPSVSMLLGQWLCVAITARDPGNKNRNRKMKILVLWLMPMICNLMCGILFALLLGATFSPLGWITAGLGLMFAALGNYLPKTRMNATIGIKVIWAYSSEENWNATHRFAGKVWVIGGVAMVFAVLLPEWAAIGVMFLSTVLLCVLPVWYSWRYFRQEKAQGKDVKARYSAMDKKILKATGVFLVLLVVFLSAVMFWGDLEYSFGQSVMTIQADWYADATIRYETIEKIEYREETVPGGRVGGFASMRLLMGFFQNEEFGTYTRYTYYEPESCVILQVRDHTWVLSGSTREETRLLYETLLSKMNG